MCIILNFVNSSSLILHTGPLISIKLQSGCGDEANLRKNTVIAWFLKLYLFLQINSVNIQCIHMYV